MTVSQQEACLGKEAGDHSLPTGKAEATVGLDTVSEAAVKARNESRSPQGDSPEPDECG